MRRVIAILVPLLSLIGASLVLADPPQEPTPRRVPLVPRNDAANVPYWGTVTELTKTSITIQFDSQKDLKPKQFLVSETLAAGKIPMEPRRMPGPLGPREYPVSPTQMYRLTDVKVGDWVAISYAHLGELDICDHICIQKRPGGRVPPLPDEAEALQKPSPRPPGRKAPLYIPYHEWINAYWDLEDKGIPFPEKFGEHRRWPVAPSPREVKVGPAIAP